MERLKNLLRVLVPPSLRSTGRRVKLLKAIIDSIPDGVIAVDGQGRVILWNKAVSQMTGVMEKEILGKGDHAYAVPFYGKKRPLLVDLILKGEGEWSREYERFQRRGDVLTAEGFAPAAYGGKGLKFWTLAAPIKDEKGRVIGAVQCIRDIAERKRMEEELRWRSFHDPLTGVYNRTYFEEELRRLGVSRSYPVSLILCDVDNLKMINDFLGHDQGDEVLKRIAKAISNSVRASDVVARVGGDEFAVLLPWTDSRTAEQVAERILKAVERERSPELPLGLSVGYATASDPSRPLEDLYREADDMMYRDKLVRGLSPRSSVVHVLKAALREKDFAAEGHIERVKEFSLLLGEALGLSRPELELLELLAEVHDIGKIGVPDKVLFKPGRLTPEEREEVKKHPEIGYRIALSSPELAPVAELIFQHHERWDGRGYPQGLKGERINLLSRIVAIADAFDAMTSDRPYRRALSREEALEELKRGAGTQFDPKLVEVFLWLIGEKGDA